MPTSVRHTGSVNNQKARAKADQLRKAGRFEEAAAEYAALWPDGDLWTGWGYAHSLRKSRRAAEALEVARALYVLDSKFPPGRSVYAWAVYDLCIRTATAPEPEVLKAAHAIIRLSGGEHAYDPTSPFAKTVLRVAKLYASNAADVRALEWLDKLDVTRLATDPGKRQGDGDREQEFASLREQYYGIRTGSLARLGRWQPCLETAMRAVSECGQLHHDNHVWFARRIALAKQRLGRPQEAFDELQQLAARKPTGFMQADIAAAAWA